MAQYSIIAVLAAVVAMTVFVAGDRLRPRSWRRTDDEYAGTLVLDLIKTFFTAVVAFVVVIGWQQYQNARAHTIAESQALVDAYWAANALPAPDGRRIQDGIRAYTEQVMNAEWAAMDREGSLSEAAQQTLDSLRTKVSAVSTADTVVADSRADAVDGLDRVAQARQDRAVDVREGLPGFLYIALIFGTVMLLLSPALSGVGVTARSIVMIALLGVVVGSALLQIHNLDHPFSGGNLVSREAYELAVTRFQQIAPSPGARVG
ncbi:hypothetical protein [Nocardia aurea]|uniref:DUF4239 domain-containing protein n=1 Tax=Nocardia aurea TaxID=2144174 RepID=A0ABV3FKS6_9NOCA